MSILVLLLVAASAFLMAFVPRWRATLRWGRGPRQHQVSRIACFMVSAAALAMAGGLLAESLRLVRQPLGYVAVGAGFLTFMAAGLYDSLRA